MNLMESITSLGLAIGLVKDLRDIDRSIDESVFRLKIADINEALADAKIALSNANLELNERTLELAQLKEALAIATSGEICPKCRAGRLQLINTISHRMGSLGHFGVEDWQFACDDVECGFEQTKMHDPHGVIPKAAAKR